MKEYYVDINALDKKPLILYNHADEVAQVGNWHADGTLSTLHAHADRPLESLILEVSERQYSHLLVRIKEARSLSDIPEECLSEMQQSLRELNRMSLDALTAFGILDQKHLQRWLAKQKERLLHYLIEDNESMMNSVLYDEEQAAFTQLAEKINQAAPTEELITLIDQNHLNRYFANTLKKLPVDFDRGRIEYIVQQDIPPRIAFTKFYEKFIGDLQVCFKAAEQKLADPVFQQAETYRRFPGIKPEKCWAETETLPTINIGNSFTQETIARHLAANPRGFVVSENDHHSSRVVLPNKDNVKVLDGSELFPIEPLETDIKQIFSETSSAANADLLIGLFKDFLKPQIEHSLVSTEKGSQIRACVWIIICQESLQKIYSLPEHESFRDEAQIEKLDAIQVYIKQQQKNVPKKLFQESSCQWLEAQRQQNIEKCFALTRQLNLDFAAAQDRVGKNLSAEKEKTAALATLLAEREEIMSELKTQEKSLSRAQNSR